MLWHATMTFGPCGHVEHYTLPQSQWRRLGDEYRCLRCGRPRRLVAYSEQPAVLPDAGPSDTG